MRRAALVVALLFVATAARAEEEPAKDARTEARERFEKGVGFFEEGAWDAALAEFLESRRLFPTRVATNDAALCLRRLGRNDEALALFEALVAEFPNAPDRAAVERQIAQLRAIVGSITIQNDAFSAGASVTVDDRARGVLPLPRPLRVSAGSHVVRVYKEGFLPHEARVEVAGGATVDLPLRLVALTQVGRLRVAESSGASLEVVVDGNVVGKTPWEGALAPGGHVVFLRGDGDRGTEPARADVPLGSVAALDLRAERLGGLVRVEAMPAQALITIDGVAVGRGPWEGRLRATRHRFSAAADDYLAQSTDVTLTEGRREVAQLKLEPDLESPAWARALPSHLFVDASFGGALVPVTGGIADGGGLPVGVLANARIGYEFGSGLSLRANVGYLGFGTTVEGRATTVNLPAPNHDQRTNHALGARAVVLGLGVGIHRGKALRWTVGLDAGVALGSVSDERNGAFRTVVVAQGTPYEVSQESRSGASWLYVGPELRVAMPIGRAFEVGLGLTGLLLKSLGEARWDPKPFEFPASRDGAGSFERESLLGTTQVVVVPSAFVRWDP